MGNNNDPDTAPFVELASNRRQFLQRAMASGFILGGGSLLAPLVHALGGHTPKELPPGRSIHNVRGNVTVDGKKADRNTKITNNSKIETGSNSMIVFRAGNDAHIMRENSKIELTSTSNILVEGLRIVTGSLLSVFGERAATDKSYTLSTTVATIGIRGTGVYAEAMPDATYICTCYGVVNINANARPEEFEKIAATHHDAPRYILANPEGGKLITPAPMKNHTDEELMLVEAIVGRVTPFSSVKGYSTPRRGY